MELLIDRRRFLGAGAAAMAGASLGGLPFAGRAAAADAVTLRAERRVIEVAGKPASVYGLRGPDGRQGLVTDLAKPFQVRLLNQSGQPTLVHWHGLKPPYRQDGVPGVSGPLIPAGGSAAYDFPLAFAGTFWMHAHTLQSQGLLAAPLIIREAVAASRDEQEIVVLLHDFSFKSAEEILAGLRGAAGKAAPQAGAGAARQTMTMPDGTVMDMAAMGTAMPDMAMDVNDVDYDAFLANDRTLADPEVVRVAPGGKVLLRVINAAAASNFHLDLGQLTADLVAVDGHPVVPMAGSAFPIAMAQRLDLRVALPKDQGAWPVLALLEGARRRTGIVLATPAARIAKLADQADVPARPLDLSLERRLRSALPMTARTADRVHHIDLTGSMSPYVWMLNGQTYDRARPYPVRAGERVEMVFANRTMMSHPMHLHGHYFQVVAIDGQRFAGAVRDTVLVPQNSSVTVAFDADNPGRWVFHCHNLYHMAAGMMAELRYDGIG